MVDILNLKNGIQSGKNITHPASDYGRTVVNIGGIGVVGHDSVHPSDDDPRHEAQACCTWNARYPAVQHQS